MKAVKPMYGWMIFDNRGKFQQLTLRPVPRFYLKQMKAHGETRVRVEIREVKRKGKQQ